MTQHLPTFEEKVETFFKNQREEIEKKEREEEEAKKMKKDKESKDNESMQATSKIKIGTQKKNSANSTEKKKKFNMVNFVDGLAIDAKDKNKFKREIVKLKAEFSYNR
jgi:uncharacterized protein with von Willebrand factor type A (vWA) domain